MKLRFILASVIFLFSGLVSRGQVVQMYYQGFETSETTDFTVNPSTSSSYSTTFYMSGSRSLELQQSSSGTVSMVINTLDFTQSNAWHNIALEFDHICAVNDQGYIPVCRIAYKRENESDQNWHYLTGQNYDMTEGGSTQFGFNGGFNKSSYTNWSSSTLSNDDWKSERFNLNELVQLSGVASSERRLMIKFEIRQSANSSTGVWRLDNVRVRASSNPMVTPVINMVSYPDGYYYPSSRGARIEINPTTTVSAGIDPDSVYLYYKGGTNGTPVRLQMTPVPGVSGRYHANIPFFGYDTVMAFYCVARDHTTNANMVTFPKVANSWIEYKCVRGGENNWNKMNAVQKSSFTGSNVQYNSENFPFNLYADARSEWVYDSSLLAGAGYKAGEMTSMRITFSAHTNTVTRQRMQVKMKNVPADYTVNTSGVNTAFTSSYMKVVYDNSLTINEANADSSQTIQFQDTFYYAGKGLLMQVVYDDSQNKTASPVKMISTPNDKKTLYTLLDGDEFQNYHPITNPGDLARTELYSSYRPAFVLTSQKNLPLLYDMGFDTVRTSPTYGLVSPDSLVAMTPDDHSIKVRLMNYGALPVNAIRISYSINDTLVDHYDWSGTLAGGATQQVTIAPNVPLSAGCYTLKVWVEDTLTAGGYQYRDHEPYNDTIRSKFTVCAGPMHGERHVGSDNADFKTIEDFLFALESCGVDDSLVVKLAPGLYKRFTMPTVTGLSEQNYIVFEPENGMVELYSADSAISIVDLKKVSHVRFRNIDFVRRAGMLTNMVELGITSNGCRIEGCTFVDSLSNPAPVFRIAAMINTGYANDIVIDSCSFVGGKVGVAVAGQATDMRSTNNTVKRCLFRNQYENAVNVSFQTDVVIDHNEMYDVLTSTMGVLIVNYCDGESKVMGNKVYTSHGAGGITLQNVIGTSVNHVIVANNMIVCEDGQQGAPLNVVSATWTDVVYNSVKLTAPNRNSRMAASFGSGGTSIQNCRFLNNILVTLDGNNYALNYMPGSVTNNTVGHNDYYTLGAVLNKKSGSASQSLTDWALAVPEDTNSVSVNPNFLNGSLVDLRTYNRLLKGVGIPIVEVTTDMYDTLRNTTASCPGAFEFLSLMYDFEPEALVSPLSENCHMPQQVELKVLLRNSGTSGYRGNDLQLAYQVNGGTPQTVTITDTIPAEDTVIVATGAMLQLPANGIRDSVYSIRVWTIFTNNDPNQTNDTNTFSVTSKYHPAQPDNDSTLIDYATAATITPTSGVENWAVYGSTAAPRKNSEIYWYRDTTDADPFHVGPTLTTDTLRIDTTFYFRQKRSKPIVRITQLEIKKDGTGTTPNPPYWLSSSRKVALQLTNIGDARAILTGDTLQTMSTTSGLNNKVYVFPEDVFIEPGESLVVQYATGTSSNPEKTIHIGNPFGSTNVTYNSNIAFLYKKGNGVLEDAVVLNNIDISAPSYIWMGSTGVNLSTSNGTAGIVRTGFQGLVSNWRVATNSAKMFLNTIDSNWIFYEDNGCEGLFASYKVKIQAPPTADISLDAPTLPEGVCNMGMESIAVRVRNYGIEPVTSMVLHYTAGADTVTETVGETVPAGGSIFYTFNGQMDMAFSHDSLLTVKVWVDTVSGDNIQYNDTNSASVWIPFTPAAPASMAAHIVSYGDRDTSTVTPPEGQIPVWYDYDGIAVDTAYTNISEILYVGGTRGVSYMVFDTAQGIVGTAAQINAATTFPSPYMPSKKYAKQQFIYSAYDLKSAGLKAGYIDTIAFKFKTIGGNNPTAFISFDEYTISLGQTSDTIFSVTSGSNSTDWKSTSLVYSRAPQIIYQTSAESWITHILDRPYYWDGESSLVVQIVHHISTPNTSGARSYYTAKSSTTLYKNGDAELTPTTSEYVGTGTRGNNRPDIRINSTIYGCESPITPYTVQMINIPSVDMAVLWPNGVDTLEYNSCNDIPIYVRVRNQGASEATGTKVYYYFDTLAVDSITVASTIASGATLDTLLFSRHMVPGRHMLKVVVSAPGDNIHSNDTISRSFMVRFCNGSYTIAALDGDYRSFSEAIDTLNIVGVQGPVVFNVAPGTYTEQVVLNNIPGSSAEHTIGFVGTGDEVLLTAATSQNNNYVMLLDSTSYVTLSNFRIEARPASGNYANALVMQKGGHITIDSLTVRVKGSVNNAAASCVVLQGDISNLTFTNNVIDSGYYSFRGGSGSTNCSDFTITGNTFKNFLSQGVNLRGVTNLLINSNQIKSGVTIDSRGLTGLYLAYVSGDFSVQMNKIYLIDDKSGGKRGIQLEHITGTSSAPGMVVNNMISGIGSGTGGLSPAKPSGIWIDSSSTYVNIYFNTVRTYCGPYANAQNSDASYSFYAGATVSHIQVMNNIFANLSKGYAYYVSELNTISISNYNAYYSNGNRPFFWKTNRTTLSALQTANNDDANSVLDEPYFRANDDLHLVMSNFSGIGQYNADVPEDIDGNLRQQVPGPTIGAHEMEVHTHDMAVVRITEPIMPTPTEISQFRAPNRMPPNIESDPVRVIATFYNNGMAPESNVQWYAYIEGHENSTRTPNRSLGNFATGQKKTDTIMMPTVLGITEANVVHVVVEIPVDSALSNNDLTTNMYLAPAYNLEAVSISATSTSTNPTGCNMETSLVKINVKNAGFKDIPANTTFKIGFKAVITSPVNAAVSTMPDTVEENTTLANQLLMAQSVNINFSQTANFYPTGIEPSIIKNDGMQFRLRGWVDFENDITKSNDSTAKNSAVIKSFYTPEPPVGYDTVFDYGSWGAVRASQENSRPIKWYRDTLSNQAFYQPSQYSPSCLWSNTPQYFSDSTYYLKCYSEKSCPSNYSSVNVYVNPPIQNDMAFEAIMAPRGGRVYMENDTVRVRVKNFGTRSQNNIPVTYQLKAKQGGTYNVIQTVTENITATVAAGQSYDYTFSRLLDIPDPLQAGDFRLTVWTDLVNDNVRRNDTIRVDHAFVSRAESTYKLAKPENPSFDITRVSFNELDFDCPQLGRGRTDLASSNSTFPSPDYPVVHVTRGLTDSLIVQVTQLDATAQSDRVKIWAFIDFDRNGSFQHSPNEMVVAGDAFYDNATYSTSVTIPNDASYGYMRMRIAVGAYGDFSTNVVPDSCGIPNNKNGHNIDVLLFVDADPPAVDLAITQIVSPRSYLIRDDQPRVISFRIANKGTEAIANPVFNYRFDGDVNDSTSSGTVTYNGTLQPGTSAIVTLPSHVFPMGITDLTIWHQQENDNIVSNNQLHYQYNRFYVVRPVVDDNFDDVTKWYAPVGYNVYTHNYWELGSPNKSKINSAYSAPNAWVTDLNDIVTTGTRGNVSYLYSPIINISQVKADTLAFRLRRDLTNNSSLRIEFYNYEGKWVNVNADSLTNWYNNADDECFDKTTVGNDYNYYWIPTNLISGDFTEDLQFRFVYTTPMKSSATASFGEGCAVDNFHLGRARRPIDVGVVAIPYPTAPAYGQTIYPKVVVKNYGLDTIRSLKLGYIHYGTYLPKETTLSCRLAPLATDTFAFDSPFIVTADFPDTFNITAFTMLTEDIYRDNDTCTVSFPLSPLENDVSAHSFLYPLDNAVAGDSLKVTIRVRNFGASPITTATASYLVNGEDRVDEEVDFVSLLGRPLNSMEYFNYTFTQRFRARMGTILLTGIVKSPQNDYIYNDTISKRVEGVNSVVDVAAASVIIDSSSHNEVRVSLVIENRGARGVNGFEVGYYIDGDSSTIYREIYSRDLPLPALETGYYSFNHVLPPRSAGYANITAFLHARGDIDSSNDTTKTFTQLYRDLELLNLIVIENAQPDCKLIAVVRNNGNIPVVTGFVKVSGNINGTEFDENFTHPIMAGQTVALVFQMRIPKSPVRRYVGSASLISSVSDANPDNNQTNDIEVRGYWEDVPLVESDNLILDQNYPNPFEDRTTIPFTLPNDAEVHFFIVDAMGHVVNNFSRHFPAGAQSITIDMSSYASGIYYYGIVVDGQRRMKKMILR